MSLSNVAIIGCGQAGIALAAYFTKKGVAVTLYENSKHPGAINLVKKQGGIAIKGLYDEFISLKSISNELAKIIQEHQIIFNVSPTYAHEEVFSALKPFLKPRHIIVNVTGNFSALVFKHSLQDCKHDGSPIIADINLSPFACRLDKTGNLNIVGLKRQLSISACSSKDTDIVIDKIKDIFPSELTACKNTIEVGLNNVNGICHPAILILNAGRIGQNKEDFYFNKDGVTPEIANVLEAVEEDRIQIASRLGLNAQPFLKIMEDFYSEKFDSIYQFFRETTVLNAEMLCPKKMQGRYLEEDIPYVFVPWLSLANLVNYKTLAIESLINIASLLVKKDYIDIGRKLDNGLLGATSRKCTRI